MGLENVHADECLPLNKVISCHIYIQIKRGKLLGDEKLGDSKSDPQFFITFLTRWLIKYSLTSL